MADGLLGHALAAAFKYLVYPSAEPRRDPYSIPFPDIAHLHPPQSL